MGLTAALKARRIMDNVERILAIELMAAAQGIDFRKEVHGNNARLGKGTQPVYSLIRQFVPFIERDTVLYRYQRKMEALVREGEIAKVSASELVK
jgi:histidine ammonia-lyase